MFLKLLKKILRIQTHPSVTFELLEASDEWRKRYVDVGWFGDIVDQQDDVKVPHAIVWITNPDGRPMSPERIKVTYLEGEITHAEIRSFLESCGLKVKEEAL